MKEKLIHMLGGYTKQDFDGEIEVVLQNAQAHFDEDLEGMISKEEFREAHEALVNSSEHIHSENLKYKHTILGVANVLGLKDTKLEDTETFVKAIKKLKDELQKKTSALTLTKVQLGQAKKERKAFIGDIATLTVDKKEPAKAEIKEKPKPKAKTKTTKKKPKVVKMPMKNDESAAK